MALGRGVEATTREEKAVFDLPLEERLAVGTIGQASLTYDLLVSNARWFCRLRWLVVASLCVFGAASYLPFLFPALGLKSNLLWPFAAAGILAVANVLFTWRNEQIEEGSRSTREPKINLWTQIIFDLVVLTCVVHFMGSVETNAPFAYLFHIALACIFFSQTESLAVTLIASVLYGACLAVEHGGLVAPDGIFLEPSYSASAMGSSRLAMQGASAVGIWIIVWYLVSRLSEAVRQRDNELAATNDRLIRAQEEKARQMAFTTHELKAPLAAIQTSLQLVLDGYCGELPPKAREVLERANERGARLSGQIRDMLLLAQLRVEQKEEQKSRINIAEVIRWCVANVMPLADEKGVRIETQLFDAEAAGVEEQLKMMFANLINNAVIYSNPGGRVEIAMQKASQGMEVIISDNGIGIKPDKISRIFDEYFRTEEAVAHNKVSTGLGLAIVAQVARNHSIKVRVESQPGVGTTFRLRFPPV